jgi:hypothetical protein
MVIDVKWFHQYMGSITCSLPLIRHGRQSGAKALFCCRVFDRRIGHFLPHCLSIMLPFLCQIDFPWTFIAGCCFPPKSTSGNCWVCIGKHLWSFATQHLPIFDHSDLLVFNHDPLGRLAAIDTIDKNHLPSSKGTWPPLGLSFLKQMWTHTMWQFSPPKSIIRISWITGYCNSEPCPSSLGLILIFIVSLATVTT